MDDKLDKEIEHTLRDLALVIIKFAIIWLLAMILMGALSALFLRSCC